MNLHKILDGVNYSGVVKDIDIKNISYDSRKISTGSIFVAVEGEKYDGNNFIDEAIKNGARVIISNEKAVNNYKVPLIKVKNTREAMSRLADNFFNHPSSKINIVGITGTNGKTTTTYIINKIFNDNHLSTGSIGTLGFISNSDIINTGYTTPESIELHSFLDQLYKAKIYNVVIEVSSHSLALHRVDDIIVNTGIYTNLSSEHLDFHGDIESYFQEKLKLFNLIKKDGSAIINIDDSYSSKIINSIKTNIITYGFSKNADIYPTTYSFSYNKMSFTLSVFNEKYKIKSNITGKYNIYNIMAAVACCIANSIPIHNIINSIERIKSIPGRMEFVGNKDKKIFIDYAHTPDAFENILSLISEIKNKNNKIMTLFGCGGDRDKSKRSIMAGIVEEYSNSIIVTSDNPRTESLKNIIKDISQGFSSKKHIIIKNREEAIMYAIREMDKNSILLILGKGRENYELVGNIKHNHDDIGIIKRELDES